MVHAICSLSEIDPFQNDDMYRIADGMCSKNRTLAETRAHLAAWFVRKMIHVARLVQNSSFVSG